MGSNTPRATKDVNFKTPNGKYLPSTSQVLLAKQQFRLGHEARTLLLKTLKWKNNPYFVIES